MSIKSKARTIGRKIRRITKLPLPMCMSIGKMVAQRKDAKAIERKYPEHFSIEPYKCGDKCCSFDVCLLRGPNGNLSTDYDFSEWRIEREYRLTFGPY
jgi:hypothetical protein